MGRREQDLDDDGPLAQFAGRLRGLRAAAGSPTYRQLASATNFSAATLARAASGRRGVACQSDSPGDGVTERVAEP